MVGMDERGADLMQIGEVADRVGLSLRTIRYYEEAELIVPTSRSQGGFRLYTSADVERLRVIKRMKPLGFTIEEMRGLLTTLDRLESPGLDAKERSELHERLRGFQLVVSVRCEELRNQLAYAMEFGETLQRLMPAEWASRRHSHGDHD